jgi:lipoate-protein ligase A
VLRAPGGRAAAFHEQALCLDLAVADPRPREGTEQRFADLAQLLVEALGTLGVRAGVGAVPGEYCPGRFSVHGAGRKLAGTAQRVLGKGWCVGAVVVVGDAPRVRGVVGQVYEALGLACDVETVGSVDELARAVTVADVAVAVLAAFARRAALHPAELDPDLLDRARLAAPAHPDLDAYRRGSSVPTAGPR